MRNKKGFTLVELLVVIAIIAILAAVVAPNAFKSIDKAKVSSAVSDYKSIKTALTLYSVDLGDYPATPTSGTPAVATSGDPGLVAKPENNSLWKGPYLDKWPTQNPWGGKYSYSFDGTTVTLTLSKVPDAAADQLIATIGSGVSKATGTDGDTVTITWSVK